MIRYFTAGESHGKYCTAILEGIPAGLSIEEDFVNVQLARRQQGYGRGKRMAIENDKVEFVAGVRWGETLGGPICMLVKNLDWENTSVLMSSSSKNIDTSLKITRSRPGHADLPGALKYNRDDVRDILERASARETAARVAAGAVAKKLLSELGIKLASYVNQVGAVECDKELSVVKDIETALENSRLGCLDHEIEQEMIKEIDQASDTGDTVGGIFTVVVEGVPAGLGAHTQWDLRLDGRLAQALMSIQAIKGVEIGKAFDVAGMRGSQVHDEIKYDTKTSSFYRTSNNAGGLEGGISNGEPIVCRAAMKPISSLRKPLSTVDILSKKEITAEIIRSDVTAITAAGVIAEASAAIEIAKVVKEKFGGDSLEELKRNYQGYLEQIRKF